MTATAMIAGMMPIAIGTAERAQTGAYSWQPSPHWWSCHRFTRSYRHAFARCPQHSIPKIPRANTMTRPNSTFLMLIGLTSVLCMAPRLAQAPVEIVQVASKPVERQTKLPGEFQPYLAV